MKRARKKEKVKRKYPTAAATFGRSAEMNIGFLIPPAFHSFLAVLSLIRFNPTNKSFNKTRHTSSALSVVGVSFIQNRS